MAEANPHKEGLTQFNVAILVVSTTGQGEQPSNARSFWKKALRKRLGPKSLLSLKIAVFGLGDSSYPNYNWAALKLRKRLMQLGAEEIVGFGKGDEQHPEGHDGTFMPWSQTLRTELLQRFPLKEGQVPIPEDVLLQPQSLLSTSAAGQSEIILHEAVLSNGHMAGDTEHLRVKLTENKRLTPQEHWQDVRQLKFAARSPVHYVPGDVLVIYPENPSADVTEILELMGWHEMADKPISFQPNPSRPTSTSSAQGPSPSGLRQSDLTLRTLLAKGLDLNAVPRRSFFSLLAHFTTDDYQKSRLVEFTQAEYLDELYDYTTRPRRSILEVLQEFDTVRIPWQWAAAVLPELRGRQFSIASGGALKHGTDGAAIFELLVAIVEYKTVIRKIRRGVCTRYLAGLPEGTELTVSLERRGLGFSEMRDVRPMVMIGPGTGVAPIRSLIWERAEWRRQQREANGVTTNDLRAVDETDQEVLFYGCRNQHADFSFRDEWESLAQESNLVVIPAFSRDQQQKVYVQDLIRLHSARVFRLLHDLHGIVYVCGSSGKMPRAVREALVEVFESEGKMPRDQAEVVLRDMEKSGSYKQVSPNDKLRISCLTSEI